MFRLALVSYLTVSTLAGPALCCCTGVDLAREVAICSAPDQPVVPAPHCHGKHGNHACHSHPRRQTHRQAEQVQPTRPSQEPTGESPHPCSCNESRADALAVKASNSDVGSLLRLQFEFFDGPAMICAPASIVVNLLNAATAGAESATFPHMSAPEILRALQSFRC